MSHSLMDLLRWSAHGLSKWSAHGLSGDVYQAVGCSCQKLGQEVEAEDKDAGNVYMEGEILKARESVREKSSKLRIGTEENPEESEVWQENSLCSALHC